MKDFVTGAQLYSVRSLAQNAEDLGKTLKALKEMGYNTVQLSGQSRDIPDEEVAELLQITGMQCVVTHNSMADFEEKFDDLVKRHQAWKCKYAGVGSMPAECRGSKEGFLDFARRANIIGKKLADYGIVFVYHNHAFEFHRFDGALGMDILFDNFGDNVQFELDSYWVQAGGCNPVEWFRKVDGRMEVAHFKDMMGCTDFNPIQTMVPVGNGNIDFPALKKVCEETHVKFAEVEQDNAATMEDPLGQMKISAENLKKMGFIL